MEEHEQNVRVLYPLIDKAPDYCLILPAGVWTLGWLGAACFSAARVIQAVDLAALVGLAVAILMASIGYLFLHSARLWLRNQRAANGTVTTDEGIRSNGEVQLGACSAPGPWARRIFSHVFSWLASIILSAGAIVCNVGIIGLMLLSASGGHGWFMIILIPFSLIGWFLLHVPFATVAAVIESLVRILHTVSSWL
jgi:hypothetical protein